MSYTQIIYHIILRTKNSRPAIQQKHAEELYRYIWGIIKNKKGALYRINGIEDHIHLISDLHPTVALSDYVKDIKVASSVWMKESGLFPLFNGWGDGYCALTYSYNEKDVVINYVKNQQVHHKKETFREEIIRVFKEMGVEIDERFI